MLKNRVALITGAATGIGLATAERFAEEGARVALCDVDEARGRAAAEAIGADARFDRVDVSDQVAVRAWVDGVHRDWGRLDILVNNAGIVRDAQLVKFRDGALVGQMAEADWDRVIAVNLKGTFNCGQAAAAHMVRQGSGVILNASSVVGLDANFGQTNYVATKAGVIGMTRTWARELGRYGIRVNAVAPGFVATEILTSMPEKVLDGMRTHTPLGRLGEPRDIANAYLFLASDQASFVSGAVLRVDGGLVVGT